MTADDLRDQIRLWAPETVVPDLLDVVDELERAQPLRNTLAACQRMLATLTAIPPANRRDERVNAAIWHGRALVEKLRKMDLHAR